jgi:predicted DNA-binding protein (MmcQ/YjbR family)
MVDRMNIKKTMNTEEVKTLCRSLPNVDEKLYGPPSNILVFSVLDKKFAYFKTSDPEKWRFSLRVTPDRFLELTDQPGIKPARYMQRFHWITIVDVRRMDADYLDELLHWSYAKALSGLSKKKRQELAP